MTHTHVSSVSARSVWALIYLTVFGTILAFTTYTWLLDHCSPTLVSTHTYANPIIAVLLGWWLAGETLDIRVLFAGLPAAQHRISHQPWHRRASGSRSAGRREAA